DLEARQSAETVGEARVEPARPPDDPEVGPPNPTVAHQGGEDQPGCRVDLNGKAETNPRDGRVDPDDPAADVGERAARVAGVQRRIGLDDVLDETARSEERRVGKECRAGGGA